MAINQNQFIKMSTYQYTLAINFIKMSIDWPAILVRILPPQTSPLPSADFMIRLGRNQRSSCSFNFIRLPNHDQLMEAKEQLKLWRAVPLTFKLPLDPGQFLSMPVKQTEVRRTVSSSRPRL